MDKWYFKLFWNAVLTTVFIGLTNGMINLFMLLADVSMDYIMAETSLRIVFVVSLNILLLGVIFLISRGRKEFQRCPFLDSIGYISVDADC